jgi:hypothetical protein
LSERHGSFRTNKEKLYERKNPNKDMNGERYCLDSIALVSLDLNTEINSRSLLMTFYLSIGSVSEEAIRGWTVYSKYLKLNTIGILKHDGFIIKSKLELV